MDGFEVPERIRERGIRFESVSDGDKDRVWTFLTSHFFDEEPLFKSIRFLESNLISGFIRRWYRKNVYNECFLTKSSILALDKEDNIVGLVLCFQTRKGDGSLSGGGDMHNPLIDRLSCILPQRLVDLNTLMYYDHHKLRYDPHLVMQDLDCNSILTCEILSVGSGARGLGMGRALLDAALEVASKEKERMDFCHGCVTGIYSQKIFGDAGFQTMREVPYSEIKDNKGDPLLKHTGEHKSIKIMYRRLK